MNLINNSNERLFGEGALSHFKTMANCICGILVIISFVLICYDKKNKVPMHDK